MADGFVEGNIIAANGRFVAVSPLPESRFLGNSPIATREWSW